MACSVQLCRHGTYTANQREVTNFKRRVSGETQNSSGNLETLPEIGRLWNFSGKYDIVLGCILQKKRSLTFYKNGIAKSGGLKVTHGVAQTTFVRVIGYA